MLLSLLCALAFAALSLRNFATLGLRECDLRTWLLHDPFGIGTFPLVKRRYGWYGVTRTYGLFFSAFASLALPWLHGLAG